MLGKYIRKRIFIACLTIFIAFIITFFLTHLAPGNAIRVLAGKDNPNPRQIEYLTKYYGLDQPLHVQFTRYLGNLLKGDFGRSIRNNRPVIEIIGERVVPTLILSLTGSILSVILGTSLGLMIGRRVDSRLDRFLCKLSYLIDALPVFWLSMMLIIVFATQLKWFPTTGMYSIRETYTGWARVVDLLRHMVLPVSALVIVQVPYYFRISRASVISILEEDFIRTFRATGMSERKIFNKYVLRNAMIPVITSFTLSLAFTISGVAMIEIVFAWPGMGRVILDAVGKRDYAVLSGVYLMISISVSFFMIITDLIYAWVDPRIRLE